MLTKLTLTIEKEVIDQAKEYAQAKNKSVSRIVEDYLKNVSSESRRVGLSTSLASPITDSLVGMFKDSGEDYKKLLDDARTERFL